MEAYIEEGRTIKHVLESKIDSVWDGKQCILYLKSKDYQWRQMEWMGWYFEYAARTTLLHEIGGGPGPRFGRVHFDYRREYVWDFKAHPTKSRGEDWAIMNDVEAVDICLVEYGGIGFVIALGEAEYDNSGGFKNWHDSLKGGRSEYEKQRLRRGAPSRRRKTAFHLTRYVVVFLKDPGERDRALNESWLSDAAQRGWRNADGSPRRPKYKIKVDEIPDWAKLA